MSLSKNILIIDDDPIFRLMLETYLKKNNYNSYSAGSAIEALRILKKEIFDIILIDFRLPDKNGLDLLKEIKKELPKIPLILMTGFVDIRTAVKAIKSGAFEYITKPVNTDELLSMIEMALQSNEDFNTKKSNKGSFNYLIGKSLCAQEIVKNIQMVAPTNLSILITGESGTGKEYVARMIHRESKRSTANFLAIDCGVLSSELAPSELFGHTKGSYTGASSDKAGHFETANGGTIFLDEIGNLSLDVQVMLLRALQEKQIRRIGSSKITEVDLRIIAATNEDLRVAVSRGTFREDLYHRLNEFSIHVSELKERNEDIMEFALFFLKQANEELEKSVKGFDQRAKEILLSYDWPGNLRELKNIIKRSVLLSLDGKNISSEVFPKELCAFDHGNTKSSNSFDLKAANFKQEKDYILTVLEKVKFNKSSAARILNIDRKTLYNKLKQFEIDL